MISPNTLGSVVLIILDWADECAASFNITDRRPSHTNTIETKFIRESGQLVKVEYKEILGDASLIVEVEFKPSTGMFKFKPREAFSLSYYDFVHIQRGLLRLIELVKAESPLS